MLSRTADNLYWLARYMERADFLARVIQASRRLASLPKAYGGAESEWESVLLSAGSATAFAQTNRPLDEANVIEFLAFAPDNPGSIRNCIELARTNARAVRTALTTDMWEAINGGYLEMQAIERARGAKTGEDLTRFLDFVKQVSLVYDGGAYRTMLRDDAYWFSRVGLFIERADNTARLLDVKYQLLLPEKEVVGGTLDYFQWTAILRAVSAHTAYHWVYRQSLKPWLVADLLDPAAGNAALADLLLRERGALSRPAGDDARAPGTGAAPCAGDLRQSREHVDGEPVPGRPA